MKFNLTTDQALKAMAHAQESLHDLGDLADAASADPDHPGNIVRKAIMDDPVFKFWATVIARQPEPTDPVRKLMMMFAMGFLLGLTTPVEMEEEVTDGVS